MSIFSEWSKRRKGSMRAALTAVVALGLPGAGIAAIHGFGHGFGVGQPWSLTSSVPLPVRVTAADIEAAQARSVKRPPVSYALLNDAEAVTHLQPHEDVSDHIAAYATLAEDGEDGSSVSGPATPRLVPSRIEGTYKTVCVRICDGTYVPMSFAALPERFADDESRCRRTCGADTRLFVFPNPGGSAAEMRDLAGRRYADLPTAYRFQHTLDGRCGCDRREDRVSSHLTTASSLPTRTADAERE